MTLQKAIQNPEKAPWGVGVWGQGELALAKETGGLALRTAMSLPLCVTSGSSLPSLGLSSSPFKHIPPLPFHSCSEGSLSQCFFFFFCKALISNICCFPVYTPTVEISRNQQEVSGHRCGKR